MRMIFHMAFRNIWRNRRRTFITAASIMFAGMLTISMTSIETGMWENMLQNVVDQSTGHVQIQSPGYFDEPTLDKSFQISQPVLNQVLDLKKVDKINPRLESFILTAYEDRTRPAIVFGVHPEKEEAMTSLSNRLTAGKYFTADDQDGILVSSGLVDRLGLTLGDSLVFFGQGYRGSMAVGMWPVQGIINLPLRELNNQTIYMPIHIAWDLFQAYDQYTSVMVRSTNNRGLSSLHSDIKNIVSQEGLHAYTWESLMPELLEAKQIDEASTLITMYILYLVVAFGIFGTLLMMLNERTYEMGVLISIGMKRTQLMLLMWLEFLFMSLIGLLTGMVIAFFIVAYLHYFPVPLGDDMQDIFEQFGMIAQLTATLNPFIFIRETFTVSIIVSILSLYPIWKIYRLNPVQAIRA